MSTTVHLNCSTLNGPTNDVFSVDVRKSANVSILKAVILKELGLLSSGVGMSNLQLWDVSIPFEDQDLELAISNRPPLHPSKKVGDIFAQADPDHIHVLVQLEGIMSQSSSVERTPCLSVLDHWRSERKKMELPPLSDLRGLFNHPLSENEKIRISQRFHDALLSNLPQDICTEADISQLFRVVKETDPQYCGIYLSVARAPPGDGPEPNFTYFWDSNIREVLEQIIPSGKSIRNNKHPDTRKLHPDFGFLVGNTCVFRGEEAGPENLRDPRAELAEKMTGNWMYHPAPYSLGYLCKGSELTLVAISPPTDSSTRPTIHDLATCNLALRRERITNILRLVNLSNVLVLLSRIVESPAGEFQWMERDESRVEVADQLIIKTYKCPDPERRVLQLQEIYTLLSTHSVPNTDSLVFARGKVVHLGPRGIASPPKSETELRECLICILEMLIVCHKIPLFHCDIRWENIIRRRDDSSKWFVIDWEDASRPPTKAKPNFDLANHCPRILGDGYGEEVDLWGIGNLITSYSAAYISTELRVLGDRICLESPNLNAQEVLTLICNSPTV